MKTDECTVLVCSCDSYEDAWYPFFKLFHKYWPECPYEIILNTESKRYSYDGLSIKCFQKYPDTNVPYGKRMIAHLKEIRTPFTMVLMDDFFFRRPVDEEGIQRVIDYLRGDPRAVVFSFQELKDELNRPSDKYPGWELRPVYGEYKYSFQAAVWRTDYLLKAWKKHETPWEWEGGGNSRSFTDKYDFYVLQRQADTPIDYGFRHSGMGIYRGKWVIDSVEDLFRENDIHIDFSIRGVYTPADKNRVRMKKNSRLSGEYRAMKSVGLFPYIREGLWRVKRQIDKQRGRDVPRDYIEYKRKQTEE